MARKLPRSGLLAALPAGVVLVLTLASRTVPAPDGSWLGVLPSVPVIAGIVVACAVVALAWSAATRAAPWLAAWPAAAWSAALVSALPWLPVPLPAARFVWLGPLAWLPWIGAIATGVTCVVAARPAWPPRLVQALADRRQGGWLAGGLALVIFAAAYASVRPILPGGDEPHYLVIAESLRRDGDLAIDDNHERGDYLAFFRGELTPDYLRRGVDRRIYSIHAPGLPVLLLPAYAAFGYGGAIAALLLATACGAALLWRLVHAVTGEAGAAWFAWASAVLASPILFHAFTVFPDGVAGIAALIAVRTLVDLSGAAVEREATAPSWIGLTAAGAALAVLPWLHTRAAVIAAAFAAALVATAIWRRLPWTRIGALLALPALSGVGWFAYFQRLYGTFDPSAPYGGYTQTAWANVSTGVAGLLLDAQFGLLVVAPVFALALTGLTWWLVGTSGQDVDRRGSRAGGRIVAITLAAAFVGYAVASASYRMWWGGASAPARFLVPMLLPMALPIGVAWSRMRGVASRSLFVAALVATAGITLILVGVDDGRLAYGSRTAVAGWTRWVSPAVDLARALPGVHRSTASAALSLALVWAGAAALAWLAIAAIARGTSEARARAVAGLVIGLAGTAAVGVAWRVDGGDADPRLPGGAEQAALATWQRHPHATLVEGRGAGVHRTGPAEARAHLVLEGRPAGSGRQLHLDLPALPPGRYRFTHLAPLPSALALRAGRTGLDWRRLDPAVAAALDVDVPVTVPASAAWPLDASAVLTTRTPRTLTVEPLEVGPSATGRDDVARQVVRYGTHDVFFLDEESYPEAPGFWVRPGRSRVVVGETSGPIAVFVRNAPVANRVELRAGAWQRTLDLAAGQELRVEVPPAGRATPIEIRAATGVRPFDGDHRNRDFRLLGVWIALE